MLLRCLSTNFLRNYYENKKSDNIRVILESLRKINLKEYKSAQSDFRNHCITTELTTEDAVNMSSLSALYQSFYNELKIVEYVIQQKISYECKTALTCPTKDNETEIISVDPPVSLVIDQNHKNLSEAVQAWLTLEEKTTCRWCYGERNDTSICIRRQETVLLPLFLKFSIESIFSKTNRVKRGFSAFKIDNSMILLNEEYNIKSVIFFINSNHYILEIKDRVLYYEGAKKVLEGWYLFDSLQGTFCENTNN